jgi:hypothetical protein
LRARIRRTLTEGKIHGFASGIGVVTVDALRARDVKLYFNYRSDETKVWDNESLRMLNSFYTIYPKKKDEGVALSLE